MDERLRDWRPTQEELARILEEMRPIIHALARRDRETVLAIDCTDPQPCAGTALC